MSIQTKLYVDDKVFDIFQSTLRYYQNCDYNNRPQGNVFGGLFDLVIESTRDDIFTAWATHPTMMKNAKIIQTPIAMDGKSRTFELIDTHCVFDKNHFNGANKEPMKNYITLSPAILKLDGKLIHEKHWKVTDLNAKNVAPTLRERVTPIIKSINWLHPETKETLNKSTYSNSVSLNAQIDNPEGSSAKVIITKDDGTEFENGKNELIFEESLDDDGFFEITTVDLKKEWEDFKVADIENLVAKVEHSGYSKMSGPLELKPAPKVLANFRPESSWKGDFGFDWIRTGDTSLFNDSNSNKFDKIVSKQYKDSAHIILEKDPNASGGYFKKDPTLLQDLKDMYKPIDISWKKSTDSSGNQVYEKHYTEWLSLKNGETATVLIHIDVTEKGDYLEFDDNPNFTITPKKIDISGKRGTKKLNDVITIECINEFTTDEEIVVKAYIEELEEGVVAGKVNVWANDAAKHKQKKVVFVQIKTPPISTRRKEKANASNEELRFNTYLNQAYIELHADSIIVDLDLSNDTDFTRFLKTNKINNIGVAVPAVPATSTKPAKPAIPRQYLKEYLKLKLADIDNDKYANYFKAFFFAEDGYHPSGNVLGGFSDPGEGYVVVFKSANHQTAAHEFLHSFSLPHSFTNKEATNSANAECTYEAMKTDNLLDYSHNIASKPNNNNRCSLYYWQWKIANNSL
ncbi:MAG: type VI secretion system tube protein TssD [Aequorivita sp.]